MRDKKNSLLNSRPENVLNNVDSSKMTNSNYTRDDILNDVSQEEILQSRPKTQQNNTGRRRILAGIQKAPKVYSNQDEYSQKGENVTD